MKMLPDNAMEFVIIKLIARYLLSKGGVFIIEVYRLNTFTTSETVECLNS